MWGYEERLGSLEQDINTCIHVYMYPGEGLRGETVQSGAGQCGSERGDWGPENTAGGPDTVGR